MKNIIIVCLCISGMYCTRKPSFKNEVILETYSSLDKQYRVEISDSNTEIQCENQPSSLFDNPKRKRFCYFRILETDSNKILYEISPNDESSEKEKLKKCLPSNFPLAIAYGFDEFLDSEHIIFTESYAWYAADDTNLTTYKFNWKNCEKSVLFSLVEEHLTTSDVQSVYTVSNEKMIFTFYFYENDKSLIVGKLPKNFADINHNKEYHFFSNTGRDKYPLKFRENVEVILKKSISNFDFDSYKYPILKFKAGNELIKIDVRNFNL